MQPGQIVAPIVRGAREPTLVVILPIHHRTQSHLLEVVETTDPSNLFLGLGEGRQKHAGQDGNDGNHHQEFNQGEGLDTAKWFQVHDF